MGLPVLVSALLWFSSAQDDAGPVRTEYSILVAAPDPRFNYAIVWIRPDPSVDYKILVAEPLEAFRGAGGRSRWTRPGSPR